MKVVLVCSHGGHLTEMLELREAFEGHDVSYITYEGATTEDLENAFRVPNADKNPIRHVVNAVRIGWHLLRTRPDVVFSTGAEIAVPACFIGKLLGGRVGHMECSAQVTHPSTTGKLVYPVCDLFLVQWENLLKRYGAKARYVGGLL